MHDAGLKKSAVCILPSVCILYQICSLQFTAPFWTGRVVSEMALPIDSRFCINSYGKKLVKSAFVSHFLDSSFIPRLKIQV